jgi:hypothetical protein
MKYKVGDVLILRVTVERVDETDSNKPYRAVPCTGDTGRVIGTWFGDDQVIAVVPQADEPVAVEEKRLEVGEYVTVKVNSARGVGKIEIDDHQSIPFMVRFSNGEHNWYTQEQLTRAEAPKPELAFKVGDWVTSRDYRDWGAGEIIEVDDDNSLPYKVRYSNGEERLNSKGYLTIAEKPVREFKVGDWVTCSLWKELGVGQIISDDHDCVPFKVKFSNGDKHYSTSTTLTLAKKPEQPEPLFKKGDKVIHRNAPHWGLGVVQSVTTGLTYSNSEVVEQNEGDHSQHISEKGTYYMVNYPLRRIGYWESLERFLVKAIE